MGSGASVSTCVGPVCYTTGLDGNSSTVKYINGTCQLSPFDTHLSTVLLAFVGSIIGGVTGGHFVAFYTAWIAWFASLRILLVAFWQVCEIVRLRPIVGGDQFFDFWENVPVLKYLFSDARSFNDEFFRSGAGRVTWQDGNGGGVTFLGWFGWLWSTCYTPTIEILWLIKNWDPPSGGLMIARGLGVAVVALPLTMDVKGRYGKALGKLLGVWAQALFSLLSTVSVLALGVISAMELILGVVHGAIGKSYWVVVIYVLFMLFWTTGAFAFDSPNDEAFSTEGWGKLIGGFAMGCFGGLFVAMPALVLMLKSPHSPGLPVKDYIRCRSESLWKRVVAVVP